MKETARIQWPDLLKAFAITLVVAGHIITTFDSRGYHQPVAAWIYSFHMPLFMMLSGMFFNFTLNKSFWTMLKVKTRALLLPLLSWSLILLLFQLATSEPICNWSHATIDWIMAGGPLRGFWYLKCLFLYLIVCYLAVKLTRRIWLGALISTALFILLPNINFSRAMIVFFWAGYAYQYASKTDITTNRGGYLALFTIIMTICYILGWYRYTYLMATFNFINYCKYIAMGGSAALFWMLLFNTMFNTPSTNRFIIKISWIGTVSLGIYCMHPLFYDSPIYQPIIEQINPKFSMLSYLIWSILTVIICLFIIKLIEKSRVLSFFLLGKPLKNQ